MPEFNIGDRVICLEDYPDDNEDVYTGCTGTVCRVQPDVMAPASMAMGGMSVRA